MMTVLAFAVAIGVLIVVHEYGHYRVAVACGVKVLRFSIGFGPIVWRRQRSPQHTEFVLSALPLGGYVRMLDEREGQVAAQEIGQAFNRQPLWQRMVIVAAGPAANLLLAVLLYAATYGLGIEEPKAVLGAPSPGSVAERAGLRAHDWVQAVSIDGEQWQAVQSLTELQWEVALSALREQRLRLQVSDAAGRSTRELTLELDRMDLRDADSALLTQVGIEAPWREPVLGEVMPDRPAAHAGLQAGDRVLGIDHRPVADAEAVHEAIRNSVRGEQAMPMRWSVERGGRLLELTVQPRVSKENGRTLGRIDAYVGLPPAMATVRYGPIDGLVRAAVRTWQVSALTLKVIGRMLIGQASLKNLSGPLAIADLAGQSAQRGLTDYLSFLALVSISLGVLNLLPLPMLDGGHLMYYLFEGVTGRPVSEKWLKWLQRGGALILLLLMSLALSNDLARLLALD